MLHNMTSPFIERKENKLTSWSNRGMPIQLFVFLIFIISFRIFTLHDDFFYSEFVFNILSVVTGCHLLILAFRYFYNQWKDSSFTSGNLSKAEFIGSYTSDMNWIHGKFADKSSKYMLSERQGLNGKDSNVNCLEVPTDVRFLFELFFNPCYSKTFLHLGDNNTELNKKRNW